MIVALALRIAAVHALRGETAAGSRVYNSAITALDELISAEPKPFIIVSTDEQSYSIVLNDALTGNRSVDIVIDVGVGSAVQFEEQGQAFVIPHTDAGTELSVNLLCRQVCQTLYEPNSGGAWGSLFRKIASNSAKIAIKRGAGTENGVRFAAAQMILTVEPLAEPPFGTAPTYVWAELIAALAGDPETAPLAPIVQAAIIGEPIPAWKLPASMIGISDATADAIGVAPLAGQLSDNIIEQTVVPDGWVDNAATIAENLPEEPE